MDIIVSERDVASLKEDFKNYLKSAYAHLKNPEQLIRMFFKRSVTTSNYT
jgi:hypothetical protein